MLRRPKNSIIGSTADQQMDAFWAEYKAKMKKAQPQKEEEDKAPTQFALVWHDGENLHAQSVTLTEQDRQQIIDRRNSTKRVEKIVRSVSLVILTSMFIGIVVFAVSKFILK